ncbi:MAG TPA: GDP-L-fucose synthase [Candidatus Moranbacteria bacterium]|nr:GDP-L-fucose synthase [Candidatus Moranbacteria bacterium]
MEKNSKIYIAGHKGLVGSAITRKLLKLGYKNLIFRTFKELDLTNQSATAIFFKTEKPEYVFLAAAKVGGIKANNDCPADFIYQNLEVQNNVISNAYVNKVKKLLFLGSSCIYPRDSVQPIKENYFLTGPLEKTNDAYAIAKIAGIKMCQSYNKQYGTNYICVMPTNLYGPNDNFDLESSHVLPALLRKFHDAKVKNKKKVVIWGTGKAMREFLYVDDLADACVHLMKKYNSSEIINIGTGKDITIENLAEIIKKIVGFKGKIVNDKTKPDGTPKKLLDVSRLHSTGWKHKTNLKEGIKKTYQWFLKNK